MKNTLYVCPIKTDKNKTMKNKNGNPPPICIVVVQSGSYDDLVTTVVMATLQLSEAIEIAKNYDSPIQEQNLHG